MKNAHLSDEGGKAGDEIKFPQSLEKSVSSSPPSVNYEPPAPGFDLLGEPDTPPLSSRTIQGRKERQRPEYHARNFCYDGIESVRKLFRDGRNELTAYRQNQLGVKSVAAFLLTVRASLRRMKRLYRVRTLTELFSFYGKERGEWQFHHKEPIASVSPFDRAALLRICKADNIEAVTWQENADFKKAVPGSDSQPELFPKLWT